MKSPEYGCTHCNKTYLKWVGCCTGCGSWETVVEQAKQVISGKKTSAQEIVSLGSCSAQKGKLERAVSGINEWDRVLGGGLVRGSFVLLAGDPGIGKSTLLLQISAALLEKHKVLYISSEESVDQVFLRASRIEQKHLSTLLVCHCCALEDIIGIIEQVSPDIVMIDSLQNCQVGEGFLTNNVNHIRSAAHTLLEVSKKKGLTMVVTGHITKDGSVAGPKMLEHVVDVVLQIQSEEGGHVRVLRGLKNRFGSTEEIGLFAMQGNGLVEQKDVQAFFSEQREPTIGSVLTCITEGSRDFIVEIQALAVPIKYGNPQRVITGADHKQLVLVCAVLERYLKLPLHAYDIFCKISGSVRIKQASIGSALACAIMSSVLEKPLRETMVILGDVGLSGEITFLGSRIPLHVLSKYGIETIACPKAGEQHVDRLASHSVRRTETVYDLRRLFG